ncbi:phosphoesterase, PA-phosphatase related [Ignicoccus hospitalis KIN4/I]|uniref:Phosphoesterase, PA-phosphatase related n=1 Tax=Ignicoccus hospitalis (strain KIN4/I / DSM 18386 / JCM 14125) TaxID=453591 RepID=A8ABZ7_IGNH4|nr:phosphoesterase, PA-phosphatase related [Ignicoccus hospitalis KIN4/I]HIH90544.1 phosphatase PAP2 family protein [Desulfurococcaceae archaeon]
MVSLAPFSTSVPCFKLPGLESVAFWISTTMNFFPFLLYTAILAYVRKDYKIVLEGLALNAFVLVLKYSFHTPRPEGSGHLTPGYPSGHTARAFWLALELEGVWRYPMLTYAALVAWSRVQLCAHYPLDVVGGALSALAFRDLWEVLLERVGALRGQRA